MHRTVLPLVLLTLAQAALADEAAILGRIRAFFDNEDNTVRVRIAREMEQDDVYDRGKVRDWLHKADLFEPLKPGNQAIEVPLRDGSSRKIVLRIPRDYDHTRPWPLIYAMHGSTGRAEQIIGYFQRVLGDDIERFVLAAPDSYADLIVHQAEWPPLEEHPAAWRAIKTRVHVDSDRVYCTGYSLGGHTTWTLAVLHADQFAGAMSLASTFTLLLPDLLWEKFMPNLQHLPLLCVWGAGDRFYGGERISPEGGIAGVNRELRKLTERFKLPTTMIELPDCDHYNVVPPPVERAKLLSARRVPFPRRVEHTFRHIYQASAYWLEGHEWTGEQWTDQQRTIRMREGEDQFNNDEFDQAVARTYGGLLGQLSGEIDGQTINISRRRVKALTVWFGDGMVDWSQPVVLKVAGRERFNGRIEPNLFVCLSEAARTRDFERLRWAGLRCERSDKAELVGPE